MPTTRSGRIDGLEAYEKHVTRTVGGASSKDRPRLGLGMWCTDTVLRVLSIFLAVAA